VLLVRLLAPDAALALDRLALLDRLVLIVGQDADVEAGLPLDVAVGFLAVPELELLALADPLVAFVAEGQDSDVGGAFGLSRGQAADTGRSCGNMTSPAIAGTEPSAKTAPATRKRLRIV
jgi:hypothetical protein